MSTQSNKADAFHALHKKGAPITLYNIWDAGSAMVLADAGAPAVATGSWSVADALGYADGEELPLNELLYVAGRISRSVDIPISVDFEGAYAANPDEVGENTRKLIQAGAIGMNFEDRVVQGNGLYSIDAQSARIAAMRAAADAEGINLFINARTDVFLQSDASDHAAIVEDALSRAAAYAAAGGSGLFVPGLMDHDLIAKVTDASVNPVNIMMKDGVGTHAEMAALGVGRISHGPGPYRTAMAELAAHYASLT